APKMFKEILMTWTTDLKTIQKARNIPKLITNFARDLIEFNGTGEFEKIRRACEQNFQAHLLATLSSGSVTKSEMAQGYMKQANEILTGTAGERVEEEDDLNVQNFDATPVWSTLSAKENQSCKNNLKRKLEDDELPGYDGLVFLFNDSNEDKIIENIDENTLEEERKLPLASDNKDSSKFIFDEMLNAFQTYQNKIPKTRRVYTYVWHPFYDYESLYGCKEITENDLQQLSQDFADHIKWKCELVSKDIQDYFDSSCEKLGNSDENKDLKHFDSNVQFLYVLI
ncbi:2928_t:CDS:2, partial [Racocetra fulgida]